MELQNDDVCLNDLEPCRKIGSGAFGNVFLTKHKERGMYYALKAVPRFTVSASNTYTNVLREKAVSSYKLTTHSS
jgi:serine/threonine protein kinase